MNTNVILLNSKKEPKPHSINTNTLHQLLKLACDLQVEVPFLEQTLRLNMRHPIPFHSFTNDEYKYLCDLAIVTGNSHLVKQCDLFN